MWDLSMVCAECSVWRRTRILVITVTKILQSTTYD